MVAGATRKISHTRKPKPKSTSKHSGWFKNVVVVVIVGFLAQAYKVTRPPRPMTCGSIGGPPITSPRIQLKDSRHLAYKEFGVAKEIAKNKIVFIHGFDSCRHDLSAITSYLSPDIVEKKGIYIVSFDRPGYGESDPHPTRTAKSLAFDIEELADQLGLGSKFFIIGVSLGGQIGWSCLKYIPHRLAGAALIVPVVNYWWSGIPLNLSEQAYKLQPTRDQWALRVAHYMPWLTYWWNTQKLFHIASVINANPDVFSKPDKEMFPRIISTKGDYLRHSRQQGESESLHRDLIIGFGEWEFCPTDLKNPFTNGEGSVHLWHGEDDWLVPVSLQRYIANQLPWIRYHEVPNAGHFLMYADGMAEAIVEALVA